MSQHARLSASAAHRWMACPGSIRLSAGLPDTPSEAAAQGTVAHDIAATCLSVRAHVVPRKFLGKVHEVDGFKVKVDEEMIAAVQLYLDEINAKRQRGDEEFIETDLTAALQKIDPDVGGTGDYARWRPKTRHLWGVDFKYGAGVLVNPQGNKQLLTYALGMLLALDKPAKEVTVTIIQPRIEHDEGAARSWTFPAIELLDFAADLAQAAKSTRAPDAPLVPGETQCKWCPAKRICPELEKQHQSLVTAEFSDLVPYDPAALARTLDAIPLVEARIKAIREFAYAEAERGNPPPGYKLVAKRPVRKWINDEAVRSWAEANAIDPFDEPKLKSPAQLEKGLDKDAKAELANYIEKVSSGHTLVAESDARPAVHQALAEEFAAFPGAAEEA